MKSLVDFVNFMKTYVSPHGLELSTSFNLGKITLKGCPQKCLLFLKSVVEISENTFLCSPSHINITKFLQSYPNILLSRIIFDIKYYFIFNFLFFSLFRNVSLVIPLTHNSLLLQPHYKRNFFKSLYIIKSFSKLSFLQQIRFNLIAGLCSILFLQCKGWSEENKGY